MKMGEFLLLELGFQEFRGIFCPWSWDSVSVGELLELALGEGGSPGGSQLGCGIGTQVQQYLRHSQLCSRCSQEGAGLAQQGVVAHGFALGQWQSVHGTPEIHP